MDSSQFLKIGIVAALLPAGVTVVLPSDISTAYVKFMEPGALLICSALSMWVASMYREELRRVFAFLVYTDAKGKTAATDNAAKAQAQDLVREIASLRTEVAQLRRDLGQQRR